MWWNDALRLLSVGCPVIHLHCPWLRLGHCNWRAAANVSSNARTMNTNLNVFMRSKHENWCLRVYQKLYQNVMKHIPEDLSEVLSKLHETHACKSTNEHGNFQYEQPYIVPTRCHVPVRRGFSTFYERVSTRWWTGKIQPSFWMTPVRPAASMLVEIAIDSLLVAFIKLIHVIGGIYMCVRLCW